MDQLHTSLELREMKAAAPQVRLADEPRRLRTSDEQPSVAADAAAATADALMHLSAIVDAPRRNESVSGSERDHGKQQTKPSDQQQPTRVVRLITAPPAGKYSTGNGYSTGSTTHGAPPDTSLPPGWQRLTHDSGLPCFVNAELQIVTWTKPYVLDAIGGDFLTLATTHVPPLSLFSRRGVSSTPVQLAAQLAAQRQPVEEPRPHQPAPARPEQVTGSRKRKAGELTTAVREPPVIQLRRQGDALPLIEVDGKFVSSPENKSIHTVLKDFSVAAWGRCPQYNYTKTGEREHPIACSVRIGRQQYRTEKRFTKFLAKDAAAEAVLNQYVPEFWAEWKKSGRVDLQLKSQEQQDALFLKRQLKRAEARQEEAKQQEDQKNSAEPKQPELNHEEMPTHAVNPQGEPEPSTQAASRTVQNQARSPERQIERQVERRIQEVISQTHDERSRTKQFQPAASQQPAPQQPLHQQSLQKQPLQQPLQQPRAQLPDQSAPEWPEQPIRQNPPLPRHAVSPQIKQEAVQKVSPSTSAMTLEEFKTLSISDPRVLQACLDLSIKTPAQVIQEYQNRHRGTSVNYNTVPHEVGGEKVFKTIVTAGSTAAEGIGSSKKVSKQLAAQHLLQVLHERSASLYHEIADLYSRSNHIGGQAGQATSGSARSSPSKKARRSPPVGSRAVAMPYTQGGQAYGHSGAARGWDGYAAYDGGQSGGWQGSPPEVGYGRKNERIVEYYGPPAGGYEGYYGSDPNGSRGAAHPHDWSYTRPMAPPLPQPPQQQQYGVYGPGSYAAAPPRPSDQYHQPPQGHAGPPHGYSYGPPQPRGAPYNRPKGSYR